MGIIITGTSGAGKSSIADRLTTRKTTFEIAKALTTRKKREDDNGRYIYVDESKFEEIQHDFFTSTEYRGKKYAVTLTEINRIIGTGKTPIVVVSPVSFKEIKNRERYLSFFIDASEENLDGRLIKRDKKEISEDVKRQRTLDRKYADEPNYIIRNDDLDTAVDLIERLYYLYEEATVLSQDDIKTMIQCGMLINDALEENIKGASYDLRLGQQYYYGGKIYGEVDQNYMLTIEPYDYAIVSSREEICLPKDVVAHFGLTVGLFCQGIILSNGIQVDPGFRGILFCLLFNTSNRPVTIKSGQHYATIEFYKMNRFAQGYKGKYQEKKDIIDVIPANAMQGAINELKKEIEELKSESRNLQDLYISIISLVIAAVSVMLIIK